MTQTAVVEGRLAFLLKKLHSLIGIVPVGAFLLEHLWINSYATKSAATYNAEVQKIQDLPFLLMLEVLFIWLPILYHSAWGFYVIFTGDFDAHYPYGKNWLYILQRVSGVAAFLFIGIHFWQMRVNHVTTFEVVKQTLASSKVMFGYFVGLGAVVFHFANGVWNFLIKWGITTGEKTQRISGYVCIAMGVALFAMAVSSLLSFK